MAQEWCAENGYELDTSLVLQDLGISAYSGANARKGALKVLLQLALEGKLAQGTIVLIEAFDRLTREELSEAVQHVLSLVNSGLVIVTLVDEKVWDKAAMNDLTGFMLSLLLLYRGHDESERKAGMLQKAFRRARKTGSQKSFGTAPGWLSRETQESPWLVTQELAESVRKVFQYAILGYGSKAIATVANREAWPVPTRLNMTEGRWHSQMPGQILRNRAVLGEHEHRIHTHKAHAEHWRGKTTGIVRDDYYPRIISDETWHRARAAIATRMVDKRRDTHYFNIFSGLMYCGYCGAPMQRKSELSAGRKPQIVCADRLAGVTHDCVNMMAPNADYPLIHAIYEYSLMAGAVQAAPGRDSLAALAALESRQDEQQAQIDKVVDLIAESELQTSRAMSRKLAGMEDELSQIESAIEKQKEDMTVPGGGIFMKSLPELERYLNSMYIAHDTDAMNARAELHLRISRLVECVWVWGYDLAIVKFKNPAGLQPVELSAKVLPSRVNPSAKYHKPPPPRVPKPKPFFEAAILGNLPELPEPRKSVALKAKEKRRELMQYEEVDELDDAEVEQLDES